MFRAEGGPKLHLPPRMRLALHEWNPRFTAFGVDDFSVDMRKGSPGWRYEFNGRQALYAVLADFDGNGFADAAIQGSAAETAYVVVVHADSTEARVVQLASRPFDPRVERGALIHFLQHVPAGVMNVGWGDQDTTLTLEHAAVEAVIFEKAAEMHYFADGRWQSIVTSD